mgnify:CR=1 FL=1
MRPHLCQFANRAAALLMKLLFGCVAHVRVLGSENVNRTGGFLLAANHISHFDPFVISSVVRRKIDWMAMAEFFRFTVVRFLLRAVDAFPADRDRADRKTIRTAIERLKDGRVVGLFPRAGFAMARDRCSKAHRCGPAHQRWRTLPAFRFCPALSLAAIASIRLNAGCRFGARPFGSRSAIQSRILPDLERSQARERIESELTSAFKNLYTDLQQIFRLTTDDLPHPPRERMKRCRMTSSLAVPGTGNLKSFGGCAAIHRDGFRRFAASGMDTLMCASFNLLQSRHHLHERSREEMEHYVAACEKLTVENFYAVPNDAEIAAPIDAKPGATITWPSPINTSFPANNTARADLFPCARGWRAPTVLMFHALMSASHIGYRRYAARFNELGWNACFVHLPYHYSRVPRGRIGTVNSRSLPISFATRRAPSRGNRGATIDGDIARARVRRIRSARNKLWRMDWRPCGDG